MFCKQCGHSLEEGQNFCKQCGAKTIINTTSDSQEVVKPVVRRIATMGEKILAVILVIISAFAIDSVLWGYCGLETTITLSVLLSVLYVYQIIKKKHITLYSILSGILSVAMAVSLSFSDSEYYKLLAVMYIIVTYIVAILDIAQLRLRKKGTIKSVSDFFILLFGFSFGKFGRSFYALFHKEKTEEKKSKFVGGVIIGLICAVPVLAIVIPLLVSSDAAFQGLVEKIKITNFVEVVFCGIFGIIFGIVIFSQSFAAAYEKREIKETESNKGLAPSIIISFLSAISVIYLVYLFSQLAYFFNAFSGILPEDFTFAQYARRGFFEMSGVCMINLVLMFIANLISKKDNGFAHIAVRLLSVFVSLFSLTLIATSFSKMTMYMQTYGLTELRIITSLFMVFLAVMFVVVIIKMFIRSLPYMQVAVVTGAILVCVIGFIGVDRIVASYNINSYLNGTLSTVDMETIDNLESDAIVPYVLKLVNDKDEKIASEAKRILTQRYNELYLYDLVQEELAKDAGLVKDDWRSYNTIKGEAKKLLSEHKDEYYDVGVNFL